LRSADRHRGANGECKNESEIETKISNHFFMFYLRVLTLVLKVERF